MQIFGAMLGLFLGPRGCIGLLVFLAVEIFVGVRIGGYAPAWAALTMIVLAFLPIGMRNGRAGMMRVIQLMLAVIGGSSALSAFVQLTLGRLTDGRAWLEASVAVGCYFGFRWLGRLIDRSDDAAAAAARLL